MDADETLKPTVFPRSMQRFSALLDYLRSEEALALPLEEVVARVEAEHQALMSLLIEEHDEWMAGQQSGPCDEEPGDGR